MFITKDGNSFSVSHVDQWSSILFHFFVHSSVKGIFSLNLTKNKVLILQLKSQRIWVFEMYNRENSNFQVFQ